MPIPGKNSIPRTVPPARAGHTMVNLNGKVYVFAGQTNTSVNVALPRQELGPELNDMWAFTSENEFVEVVPDNDPPTARHDHAAVVTQDKMHVSFGKGGDTRSL